MRDAVMGYLQVASGLSDVTKAKATATAKSLLGDGGLTAASDKVNVGQVQSLAEEIVAASKANRELLLSLVRAEVDRAVAALGLATRDDVAALRRQVERVQRDLAGASAAAPRTGAKKATASRTTKARTTKPRATKATTPKPAPPKAAPPKPAASVASTAEAGAEPRSAAAPPVSPADGS